LKVGEIHGILGHNGCGKSTALNIIAGIIKPTKGKIQVFGNPINKINIGYCRQGQLL
jgi:ABC-type multidrug transport system ATPase subunit